MKLTTVRRVPSRTISGLRVLLMGTTHQQSLPTAAHKASASPALETASRTSSPPRGMGLLLPSNALPSCTHTCVPCETLLQQV